jgi:hypothetical protein
MDLTLREGYSIKFFMKLVAVLSHDNYYTEVIKFCMHEIRINISAQEVPTPLSKIYSMFPSSSLIYSWIATKNENETSVTLIHSRFRKQLNKLVEHAATYNKL